MRFGYRPKPYLHHQIFKLKFSYMLHVGYISQCTGQCNDQEMLDWIFLCTNRLRFRLIYIHIRCAKSNIYFRVRFEFGKKILLQNLICHRHFYCYCIGYNVMDNEYLKPKLCIKPWDIVSIVWVSFELPKFTLSNAVRFHQFYAPCNIPRIMGVWCSHPLSKDDWNSVHHLMFTWSSQPAKIITFNYLNQSAFIIYVQYNSYLWVSLMVFFALT